MNATNTNTQLPLNPLVYVCILSEFNLPQLEAILAHRPSTLVFVVSDFQPAIQGAKNLSLLLREELPDVEIYQLGQQSGQTTLQGDNLLNAQQWSKEVLTPFLDNYKSLIPCWLNMTGGTKMITLALTLGYNWNRLDYKPVGQHQLYSYILEQNQIHSNSEFLEAGKTKLPAVTPQQVARIYNSKFQEKPLNPVRNNSFSQMLAEKIFIGLNEKNPELKNIFNGLNRIWSQQRDKQAYPEWQEERLSLPLKEFLDCEIGTLNKSVLNSWLEQIQQLSPECFFLDGEILNFPGNKPGKNKEYRNFRNWISGDWLEQLTGHWLQSTDGNLNIPASAIAYGIQAGNQNKADQAREADLLVHHNGRTHVIEVKTDIPPGSSAKDAVQQLGSNNAYGRSNRILMVGPEFRYQLEKNHDWEDFKKRCLDSRIKVCADHDQLVEAFGSQ